VHEAMPDSDRSAEPFCESTAFYVQNGMNKNVAIRYLNLQMMII
jgi:hypothetical protein